MYKPRTFEEKMYQREVRMRLLDTLALEVRVFYLERRLGRLERAWPGNSPDAQRRLRRERILVRHEFEMLKIDLETLERRARPLWESRRQ